MRKYILLIVLLPLFTLNAQDTFTFGVLPYDTPFSSINNQNSLIRYLEQQSGFTFKKIVLNNDEELLEAYKSGEIDIAWIGTYQYMKYHPQLYSYPIVKPVRFGRSFYRSAFVTHNTTDIQSLDMLKGKTIAFVSRKSEAGYIYPAVMLAENNMYEGNQYFAQYLKGHDNVLFEVYDKKYDAGCVFDSAVEVFLNRKQQSEIRVIAYSKEIPYEPLIVSKRLPAETAQQFQKILLECRDAALLDTLDIQGFTGAEQRDYTVYPSRSFELFDYNQQKER